MLTNRQLGDLLKKRGFKEAEMEDHGKGRLPRTGRWFYLLGNWGLNFGTSSMNWEQASFLNRKEKWIDDNEVGEVHVYTGKFKNPGIHTTPLSGGAALIGPDFSFMRFDGTSKTAGVRIANAIVKLLDDQLEAKRKNRVK